MRALSRKKKTKGLVLLPCPFCGETNKLHPGPEDAISYTVVCLSCGGRSRRVSITEAFDENRQKMSGLDETGEKLAILHWNGRKNQPGHKSEKARQLTNY